MPSPKRFPLVAGYSRVRGGIAADEDGQRACYGVLEAIPGPRLRRRGGKPESGCHYLEVRPVSHLVAH
jgi:hypothetical protein